MSVEPCLPVDFCPPVADNGGGSSLEGDGWFASTSVLLDERPLCGRPVREDFDADEAEDFMVGRKQEQNTCSVNVGNCVFLLHTEARPGGSVHSFWC